MKRKRHIARTLLFISLLVLMIPVIPHHHHANGLICLKNDSHADCREHHHTPTDSHHCCNTTGCMTTHFVQQMPQSDDADAHPNVPHIITLFITPPINVPSLSELEIRRQEGIYLETFHDTLITRATGLRAPPSVLA